MGAIMTLEDDNEKPRSIRMPVEVWDFLDKDAKRCKRSSSKHLEAILSVYYGLKNVELMNLDSTRTIVSPGLIGENSNDAALTLNKTQPETNYLVSHGNHKVPRRLSKNAKRDIEEGVEEAKEIARHKKTKN
jgi:hypothetical protein